MTKLNFCRLSLALSLGITLSACTSMSGESVQTPHNQYQLTKITELDHRQRADLYEAIITADMAEHQGDHQTAMSYYLFAADLSKDMQLIQKSVEAAQRADDPLGMEQAAQVWLQVQPGSIEARTLILQSQIGQQNGPEALATAQTLLNELESSEARYQLIEENIVPHDPRVSFSLLRDLQTQMPNEVAIETGIAKFIMNLANANNQSDNMLNQALNRINNALTMSPAFLPAVRIKSHVLFQLRRDDEARNYLNDTFNAMPDSAEVSQMLGQLLYDLRDFEASVAHYTDWLNVHPDDLEARFYLAASHYALNDFSAGLPHFKFLLDQDYKTNTTGFYCGDSASKLEQSSLAIDCFNQVEAGRFWIHARVQLARIYSGKKQFEKALEMLTTNRELDENDKIKLVNAEIDLLRQHFSKERAKQRLEQALTESPENLVLLLKKIELYELTDKPEKLVPLLIQARDLFEPGPKLDEFNLAAAALLNNNGHIQSAIDWINQALEIKPEDKDLLYTRAIYKEPLGLLDEMVADFKQLHNLYPDDLNIQNALGYTLADQNIELDYAKTLIANAYRGLPDNPAVIDSMGWIAYRQGEIGKAIEYLTRAFKLAPSADVAAHLGEVLWQDGKKDVAKKVWRKGLELDSQSEILGKTLNRLNVELNSGE